MFLFVTVEIEKLERVKHERERDEREMIIFYSTGIFLKENIA